MRNFVSAFIIFLVVVAGFYAIFQFLDREEELDGVDFTGDVSEGLVYPGGKKEQSQTQREFKPGDFKELKAEILEQGSGRVVKDGDIVRVHYEGFLEDGAKFDSSRDRGDSFSFKVGAGRVIPGWDLGIIGMKLGEVRRLYIPSKYAYGEQGKKPIPPNTNLVFEIELLEIK